MKKLILAAAALGLGLSATPASADDATSHELREVDWYRVQFIKWKEGKGGRAHEIIEIFEKTDKALGWNDVIDFHMSTGEWDSVVAMKMRNGIASMGWKKDPDGDKWMAEFSKQAGGEDKAKALFAEFDECILEQQTQIGHIDINE
ncbi:hypothetical protein [Qipengyuania soli]|uniref:Uncharacterized protein n=1 Tax=Qipengyuania soli TaxID=2782568 RepID=A0A7S8F5Z8_9SPHN|nr:hypothetical protein [Qipengyuania soli]QPC99776.1 hypothetical protein IRL76_04295 [Qipengyuania soli]